MLPFICIQALMHLRKQGSDLLFKHSLSDLIMCVKISVKQTADAALALPEERRSSACQWWTFVFALHYEQVVVGISRCGSTHPCGSDCFVSIYPSHRNGGDCSKNHLVSMTEVPLDKVRAAKLVISSHKSSVFSVERTRPWPLHPLKES